MKEKLDLQGLLFAQILIIVPGDVMIQALVIATECAASSSTATLATK
jgi:hypothetical protein